MEEHWRVWAGVAEAVWSHDRLTAVMSNVDGVECYFVKGIYDEKGNADSIRGLTSESGIVISACAAENTLAHEIGHLCGARDIYIEGPKGVCNISNDKVSMLNMPGDWNGGCVGHGSAGARYYAYGLDMKRVIGRLLMYGESSDDDRRRDLPAGDVLGVWYHFENDVKVYERSDAPIGMVRGAGFAVPRSE